MVLFVLTVFHTVLLSFTMYWLLLTTQMLRHASENEVTRPCILRANMSSTIEITVQMSITSSLSNMLIVITHHFWQHLHLNPHNLLHFAQIWYGEPLKVKGSGQYHYRLCVIVRQRTEIPHDCVRPSSLSLILPHPRCIHSHHCMTFLSVRRFKK